MLRPFDMEFLVKKPHHADICREMRLFGNWAISSAKLSPFNDGDPWFCAPVLQRVRFFQSTQQTLGKKIKR